MKEAVGGMEISKLLGPDPPFKVCPSCGSTSTTPWQNPLLSVFRDIGRYRGEVFGGSVLCERCDEAKRCEVCLDTGWETVKVRGRKGVEVEERVRRCDCAKKDRVVMGLPVEYTEALMVNFTDSPERRSAIDSARRWLGGEVADLYIRGDVGVGKTRLLASLLNEIKSGSSAAFVRVPELLDRTRLSMGSSPSASTEEEYLRTYRDVAVLGLDDVGADKGSDYGRRMLQMLYESRLDHRKRTIWTSNLSLSQLEEFFGDERLCSRIAGNADVVVMEGDDVRVG